MVSQSFQPFCRTLYCDRPTDRPTDYATRSVTIGRVRTSAMRPNKENDTANKVEFIK